MITSDKCYFNLEKKSGYTESGLLGGKDMYSGSKAATEVILNSFFILLEGKIKTYFFVQQELET